jgi:hypothetical protein
LFLTTAQLVRTFQGVFMHVQIAQPFHGAVLHLLGTVLTQLQAWQHHVLQAR